MRDEDLLRLTNSNQASPTVVIQQPAEPWLKKRIMGIAGGVTCACIVSVIANQGGFKWGAVQVAKVVLWFDKHPKPPTSVPDVGGILNGGKVPVVVPHLGKTKEQLEFEARQKEENRLRAEESERNTLYARADAIKFPYDKAWTLEKLRIEVRNAEQAKREADNRAIYDRERRPLLAEAKELDLVVTDDIDNDDLKKEIKEERDFRQRDMEYQKALLAWEKAYEKWLWNRDHGNNAACPRCHMAFRAKTPKGERICARCRTIFPVTQATAMYRAPAPPKKPAPPKRNPGFFQRAKKGLFGG